MKQILQKSLPYPDSLIWQLHRRYFHEAGSAAWGSGSVPSRITSNRRAAYQNARVVLEALRQQNIAADETVFILEVGSGSGQFAVNFLNCFQSICAEESEPLFERLHYMVTDYALPNLKALSVHPGLTEYLDQGRVGLYLNDVLKPNDLVQLDGSRFEPVAGMFSAVIANYVHCVLPMTIFRKKDGKYYEKHISIEMENDAQTVTNNGERIDLFANVLEPGLMAKFNLVPRYDPVSLDDYIATPQIRQAVRAVADGSGLTTIPVPVGTCLHLMGLQPFLKTNGICLISDKGFVDRDVMDGDNPFLPTIHGNSLAHQVNFPLVASFARSAGFSVIGTTENNDILKTMLLVNGRKTPLSLVDQFRELFVESNGNIDASDFVKAANDYYRAKKWEEAAVFYKKGLRLRQNSPFLLMRLAGCLQKLGKMDAALDCCRHGKAADVSRSLDFDFEQGRILYNQKKCAEALKHFEISEAQFGGCKQGYYNMGLCWAGMKQLKKAHAAYAKALEIDGDYRVAQNAIDKIKAQVFSDWLARTAEPAANGN
jgi:hypothetical protein